MADHGTVHFSNFDDQRLYRQDPGQAPRPITPDLPLRSADGISDASRQRIISVREDHGESDQQAITTTVAINLAETDGVGNHQLGADGRLPRAIRSNGRLDHRGMLH